MTKNVWFKKTDNYFVFLISVKFLCSQEAKWTKNWSIPWYGNRQKSPWKKSFRKKVLKFYTKKVLWKKSPFIKKSPEIKSYRFKTLFSKTFFLAPVWFYTKKSSEKSPLTSENAWFTMEKSPGCKPPINNRRFSGASYFLFHIN